MCQSANRAPAPADSSPARERQYSVNGPSGRKAPTMHGRRALCRFLAAPARFAPTEREELTQFVPAPAKLSMYCPCAQSWQLPGSLQSVTRGSSKSPAPRRSRLVRGRVRCRTVTKLAGDGAEPRTHRESTSSSSAAADSLQTFCLYHTKIPPRAPTNLSNEPSESEAT